MKYTVTEKPLSKIAAIFGMLFAAAIEGIMLYFFHCDFSSFAFPTVMCVALFVFSAAVLYCSLHPRVKVDGEYLTCYPRFGCKTEIRAGDITKRTVSPVSSSGIGGSRAPLPAGVRIIGNRIRYNPLATAMNEHGNALPGTRLDSNRTLAVRESICYYIGSEKIITIHTGMKNALLLDGLICSHMKKSDD